VTVPYGRILGFLDRSRYFSIKQLLSCTHEAEWTPFQTHYLSENLVVPGIESRHLDLYPGTLTTRPQRRSILLLLSVALVRERTIPTERRCKRNSMFTPALPIKQ
jgi:hypothetical protein